MSYVGIILNLYNFLEKVKILNPQRQLIILQCCSVRFISRTDPTSNQLGRAVQYTYTLYTRQSGTVYKAKRDGTPDKPAPPSTEILVEYCCHKII